MKKLILLFASALFIGNLNAKETTVTLQGQKVGTETSTTIGTDGTITLKANCTGTNGECASATITTNLDNQSQFVVIILTNDDGTKNTYQGTRTLDMPMYIDKSSLQIDFIPTK